MKTLEDAIKERDEFLKEHPELQGLQDEIDEVLSKTPEKMRLDTIGMMMTGKASKLGKELFKLQRILEGK